MDIEYCTRLSFLLFPALLFKILILSHVRVWPWPRPMTTGLGLEGHWP